MRLVDADELREEILKEDYDNDTINNLLDLVDFSKTVDVEPIKHGRGFLKETLMEIHIAFIVPVVTLTIII